MKPVLRITTVAMVLISKSFLLTAQPFPVFFWSGALTSESIKVNVKISEPCQQIRLVLSNDPLFSYPQFSENYSVDSSTNLMLSMKVDGLQPNSKYYYAFEINSEINKGPDKTGSFTTPLVGPFSFKFTFNSCIGNASHNYSNMMKLRKPLFWICSGDLHYKNPNSTDVNVHREKYEGPVLAREPLKGFLRSTPAVYTWDDHDYCGNDSDSLSAGKESARQAYREYVPHYDLPDAAGPIYQSFTIGRVHFIVTDLRSTKSPAALMSPKQHEWMRKELLYSRDQKMMAVWVSSMPWYPPVHYENWGAYPAERRSIANFLCDNQIRNLMILTGDAHMLAIDDGANGDFTTGHNSPYRYPVFNASAVAKSGAHKGGVYNHGSYLNPNIYVGQYGLVRVFDNGGDTICFSLEGYRTDTIGSYDSLLVNYTFCRSFSQVINEPVNDIFISPNPAESEVNILLAEASASVEVTLTDLRGRKVFKNTLFGFKSQKVYTVQLPSTIKGNYILTIFSNNMTYHKRLIVN